MYDSELKSFDIYLEPIQSIGVYLGPIESVELIQWNHVYTYDCIYNRIFYISGDRCAISLMCFIVGYIFR